MADTPAFTKPESSMPYVWAGLILVLMSGLFILALLLLRPVLDPLVVIATVLGITSTMFSGIAAFLKSQQTHVTVNSQLTAWKAEFFKMAHAEGIIAGVKTEQERIAEITRIKALTAPVIIPVSVPMPAPVPAAHIISAETPINEPLVSAIKNLEITGEVVTPATTAQVKLG